MFIHLLKGVPNLDFHSGKTFKGLFRVFLCVCVTLSRPKRRRYLYGQVYRMSPALSSRCRASVSVRRTPSPFSRQRSDASVLRTHTLKSCIDTKTHTLNSIWRINRSTQKLIIDWCWIIKLYNFQLLFSVKWSNNPYSPIFSSTKIIKKTRLRQPDDAMMMSWHGRLCSGIPSLDRIDHLIGFYQSRCRWYPTVPSLPPDKPQLIFQLHLSVTELLHPTPPHTWYSAGQQLWCSLL